MRINHITAGLSIKRGGPTKVITGMTKALAEKGMSIKIFAVDDGSVIDDVSDKVHVRIFDRGIFSGIWPYYSPSLYNALREESTKADLLHVHEIWHYPQYAAYRVSLHNDIPLVITTHGTLEPWCLGHKAFKKRLYSWMIQRKVLSYAQGLHAVSLNEIQHIANYVRHDNIFFIPNAIDTSEYEVPRSKRGLIEDRYPELIDKKIILFMGRIHQKKGLDLISNAYADLIREMDDIHLLIAGPDGGYKQEFERRLRNAGALGKTTFTGMLQGDVKLSALYGSDVYVLPSYSEGFSMSTLEAMYCELPVIITKECNFDEIEEYGAGKVIATTVNALKKALSEFLSDGELRQESGLRGKKLVKERYTWDINAQAMIRKYAEILGK